ncbi:hypothetical protein [Marinicella meishanensis]|uniref:hypothetical protein n=1 Tax=Marinicella meishanensis TaxID=2873263 RepID=UPI001CBB292B|nr:hypothetical protein [Marinicella sp. NBU2979]
MKIITIICLLLTGLVQARTVLPATDESPAAVPTQGAGGDVRVPLSDYIRLIEAAQQPEDLAPADYAIGQASATVVLSEQDDHTTAQIQLSTTIEVFADQWTLIPVLPYGAAINSVLIDGQSIQLVQKAEWMSWSTQQAGTYRLVLNYRIDAQRSAQGYVLPVPIPRATSTELTVQANGQQLDMAVIPSSAQSQQHQNNVHTLRADIPTTSALLITWREPSKQPLVVSRAQYSGELQDQAVTFQAQYQLELFTAEAIAWPIMPDAVILSDVLLDQQPATVFTEGGWLKVMLQGRGQHQLQVNFQTPVVQQQGPPAVHFPIPAVPISAFTLKLPGKKDITFSPPSQVLTKTDEAFTTGQAHIPLSDAVSISWIDAIPKDIRDELRANANIYHAISAEEGVLYGRGLIDYEITQGETSLLTFQLPIAAQVNRITATTAGISDWLETADETTRIIQVYLDRKVSGAFQLQVEYEQLLGPQSTDTAAISVPIIRAEQMHRQRGIVALLAGQELTLEPVKEQGVSRVGENQLPAFFRNPLTQTIAHTFKYTSAEPLLTVKTMAPIRQQGKYDAQVDTLVSLGEVTMRGSAGIQIDVKSGSVLDLNLALPAGVNVLNVTGPSLRQHQVKAAQDGQLIAVEFTQEMSGQFQLEVNYEYILSDSQSELAVPTIQVTGAEVQHGRIAVEALTAIEIQAAGQTQLSTLEINELPQQLVLKTTNPILLAFKYVNADAAHQLTLQMTRHQELATQVAAIETADYQTLITDDGLAVTTARFDVRNSRMQFLRLSLPAQAEVWSVFVDGQAEKPANAQDQTAERQDILIKMLNSASGFPVEVVYAVPMAKMGLFGTLQAQLPIPDMVVTHSFWDVYLPQGPNYQAVDSNMQVVSERRRVNPVEQGLKTSTLDRQGSLQVGKPLRMSVPQQGILYRFEKLYANQSDTPAGFEIRYASSSGDHIGLLISLVSVVLIWLVIFAIKATTVSARVLIPVLVMGLAGLLLSFGYLKSDPFWPLSIAIAGGVVFLLLLWLPKFSRRQAG